MASLGGTYYTQKELEAAGFKRLGANVKIHNRSSIYLPENISIGDNVRIDDFCVIIAGSLVDIGNYVHIANFCYLGGRAGIVMEDFSGLAPRVSIFSASDDYSGNCLTNPTVPPSLVGGRSGLVSIKKHAIIGTGSVVLPGVTLEEGTSVGAMSVIRKSTDPWCIYLGNPAKKISTRSKNLLFLEAALNAEVVVGCGELSEFLDAKKSLLITLSNCSADDICSDSVAALYGISTAFAKNIRIGELTLFDLLRFVSDRGGTVSLSESIANQTIITLSHS